MEKSKEKVYIGISAGNWKWTVNNHRHSFSNPLLRNQIALLMWFSSLRERDLTPLIKWRFIKKSPTHESFKNKCNHHLKQKKKH